MNRYILVADEMGTPGMATGVSNTFAFGGYVVAEDELPQAIAAWQRVKTEMCGNAAVELKWKHFFVDADDARIPTPIIIKNPRGRRQLAALALDHLFRESPIVPVVAVSRKDRATEMLIVQSKKGNDKIDDDLMWFGNRRIYLRRHLASRPRRRGIPCPIHRQIWSQCDAARLGHLAHSVVIKKTLTLGR